MDKKIGLTMKTVYRIVILLICSLLYFASVSQLSAAPVATSRSEGMPYRVVKVAEGLGIPWGMAFLSPTELIITERQGNVRLLDLQSGALVNMKPVPPVKAVGQGGLMDVAVPHNYRPGDWIYFTYSKPANHKGVTVLARAKRNGYRIEEWQDIVVTRSDTNTGRHYGSRIAFDGRGHLFFTVGDRGKRANGQDLTIHAGSILRVKLDGTVPTDNPFLDKKGVLPEIWSYGHRNPQGISFDKLTGRLWAIEHGPRGGDEINLIEKGLNYGWPVISYGKEYWGPVSVGEGTQKPGMEQPIKYYVPSIAPSSLLLYSGKAFPQWRGSLISGSLKLTHLNRITLGNDGRAIAEERLLGELKQRIRALAESPEGWIYFSTDSGVIFRLMPSK